MIDQYIFIYIIGENDKENERHRSYVQSFLLNVIVEVYNNSWIAFNALRSDNASNKSPDLIFIDYNMLHKNGFHFLEEYAQSQYFDSKKTRICILAHEKNVADAKNHLQLSTGIKVISKPLSSEVIQTLIEY